jgi:hypothetical protein
LVLSTPTASAGDAPVCKGAAVLLLPGPCRPSLPARLRARAESPAQRCGPRDALTRGSPCSRPRREAKRVSFDPTPTPILSGSQAQPPAPPSSPLLRAWASAKHDLSKLGLLMLAPICSSDVRTVRWRHKKPGKSCMRAKAVRLCLRAGRGGAMLAGVRSTHIQGERAGREVTNECGHPHAPSTHATPHQLMRTPHTQGEQRATAAGGSSGLQRIDVWPPVSDDSDCWWVPNVANHAETCARTCAHELARAIG